MINREEAIAAVKKHGGIRAAARALGMPLSTLQLRLAGVKPKSRAEQPPAPGGAQRGRSLQEFRCQHDKDFIVPARIREGLKALRGGWEYEGPFAKLAAVSLSDLANYREAFTDYIVVVRRDGKRAWAATPALAAKMREMVR